MTKFHIAQKSLVIVLAAGIFSSLSSNLEPVEARQRAETAKFSQQAQWPNSIPLAGTWRFLPGNLKPDNQYLPTIDDTHWQEITVPSNWFLQGKSLAGVVWYRRQFVTTPHLRGKVVKLVFEGVDYTADVWLNGQYLGFHEGYFQPFSFLVSEQLRFGAENVLVVRVNSPHEESGQSWSLHKRLIKGIFSHHDTRPGGAWSLRGQEQNTGGIWAPVYLQVSEALAIDTVMVTPHVNLGSQSAQAEVELTLTNPGTTPKQVQVHLQLKPHNFPAVPSDPVFESRTIKPGVNRLMFKLPSHNTRLWWTWEHGQPNLYQVEISVVAAGRILDRAGTVFGFRTIAFEPNSKVMKLNGKRLFLRGTNYISSQWLSEMTPEKYAFDIALMKQANINAIRVHAHIEAQQFYRLCDQAGILIWQDFPLQWGYTDDPSFVDESIRQAKEMVALLYNHASIMAWSLHNEPPWDATWMKDKYPDYNPTQNRQLDEALFASLINVDQTRYLHKYSTVSEHPWWGWYSGTWKDYAQPTQEALITEFGAQALPDLRSLRRIFTEAELWPDTEEEWEKWSYHNFQRRETFEIAKVTKGNNPQEFINNSQRYQAQLVQLAAESYRRQRFNPVTAIFQFMFVENWPSLNWGIVDYWRNSKEGYEALKIAYQPVLPSIVWKKQVWQQGEPIALDLWIINDLWSRFSEAQLTYTLSQNWQTLNKRAVTVDIESDSGKKILTVRHHTLKPGDYELVVKILARDGNLLGQNAFRFAVRNKVK